MEKKFLASLLKLNAFLETPHPQELELDPNQCVSSRRYLDGDELTLADCNLLPKLNIVKVSPSSTSFGPNHHHHKRKISRDLTHPLLPIHRWCLRLCGTLRYRLSWGLWLATWKTPTSMKTSNTPAPESLSCFGPTTPWPSARSRERTAGGFE